MVYWKYFTPLFENIPHSTPVEPLILNHPAKKIENGVYITLGQHFKFAISSVDMHSWSTCIHTTVMLAGNLDCPPLILYKCIDTFNDDKLTEQTYI